MRRIIVAAFVLVAPASCSFLLNDKFSGGDAISSPADAADVMNANDGSTLQADASDAPDAPAGDPYFAAVMADAPVSYWRLDETTGGVLRDEMTRHDLSVDDPPRVKLAQRGAVRGTSVTLDGQTKLVLAGTVDLGPGRTFTIEAWIRPTDGTDAYRRIFSKITVGAGPLDGTYLWVNGGRSIVGFERWREKSAVDVVYWDARPPADSFTHVVVVVDGVRTKMYANGGLVGTANPPTPAANPDIEVVWGDKLIGGLDELAFYDRPLTAERVKAHHDAAQKTPP